MKIVSEQTFRSDLRVNMTDDRVRVIFDADRREWTMIKARLDDLIEVVLDPCPTCHGTGADDGHVDDGAPNPPPCPDCRGLGRLPSNPGDAPPDCPTCNGTGREIDLAGAPVSCPTCKGSGRARP